MSQVLLDFWKWQKVVQHSSALLSAKDYVEACGKVDPEVLKANRKICKEVFAEIDPASELKIIKASKSKDFKSEVHAYLVNDDYYEFYTDEQTSEDDKAEK